MMEMLKEASRCGLMLAVVLCGILMVADGQVMKACNQPDSVSSSIYDFSLMDVHNTTKIDLKDYKGKVVLIVNVASYCVFTPHYHGMNDLMEKYKGDLIVLGFPSNQFGMQEPGVNGSEIMNAINNVRPGNGFQPKFPIFERIDINGKNEHPLYTYLKAYCPPMSDVHQVSRQFWTPHRISDVTWNWETFLVSTKGKVIRRGAPSLEPMELENDIVEAILNA